MPTKIKSASVKVMLSYDYSHFEASMQLENDEGLGMKDIDNARKNCQRLADKAVGQYKTAKDMAETKDDKIFEQRRTCLLPAHIGGPEQGKLKKSGRKYLV